MVGTVTILYAQGILNEITWTLKTKIYLLLKVFSSQFSLTCSRSSLLYDLFFRDYGFYVDHINFPIQIIQRNTLQLVVG